MLQERERNLRRVQLEAEQRRAGLRDNIRVQMELARQQEPQRGRGAVAGPPQDQDAEILLLRQYLQDRDAPDMYTSFGQTVAGFLRAMPAAASGHAMVTLLDYLNKEYQDCLRND